MTSSMVFSATDARDLIFALLGVISATDRELDIKSDYSMSCRDVYINTAKSMLKSEGLCLLSFAQAPRVCKMSLLIRDIISS